MVVIRKLKKGLSWTGSKVQRVPVVGTAFGASASIVGLATSTIGMYVIAGALGVKFVATTKAKFVWLWAVLSILYDGVMVPPDRRFQWYEAAGTAAATGLILKVV